MKLKTKFQDEDFELGEVVEGVIVECLGKHEEELRVIATAAKGGQRIFYYSSIKKFMDDWEDAPEEPKKYWFIGYDAQVECISENDSDGIELDKSIGNYFETKEEAEKAVEKLKAWQRLKDKGFKFDGHDDRDRGQLGDIVIYAEMPTIEYDDDSTRDDLDLLFGGEE